MGFSLSGFASGITSTIGKVIGGATKAASKWGGKAVAAYGAAKSGNILGMIGHVGSALMTKKTGGSGEWQPVDTSVHAPQLGSWRMETYKAGSAQSPDVRLKTVDGDTLNAEWEYRLTKALRNKNLYE